MSNTNQQARRLPILHITGNRDHARMDHRRNRQRLHFAGVGR